MPHLYYSHRESAEDVEKRLLETARRKGVKPYRLAQECLDECIRLNDPEQIRFWRGVWIRVMADEYVVTIPGGRTRYVCAGGASERAEVGNRK